MVRQAVEERTGEPLGAESFGPLVEWQIAGDERGATLIAQGDHLEQQFGAGFGEGHEAEFVDDQQFMAGDLLLQAEQAPLVAGLHQRIDQRGGRGEADGEAFLAGVQPEPQGEVILYR